VRLYHACLSALEFSLWRGDGRGARGIQGEMDCIVLYSLPLLMLGLYRREEEEEEEEEEAGNSPITPELDRE